MRAMLSALILFLGASLFVIQPTLAGASTPIAGNATPSPDLLATYVGLFAEGEVQQPSDIAISADGSVWITDMATDQILKFDADGKRLLTFGGTGEGPGQFEFADFGAIGLDGEGNVFVLDTGHQRVQKFTSDVKFVLEWGTSGLEHGQFQHPSDIAVRPDGISFVVDALSGVVQQFDPDGTFVREIVPSTLADQFYEPARLGLDSADNLYVPDLTRIYVFDPDGRQILAIQTTETDNGSVQVGNGVAMTSSGFLYVSDWQANRIAVFDPDGKIVGYWGSYGTEPGQFNEVDTLVFDSTGHLLVLDYANQRIQVFEVFQSPGATPVAAQNPETALDRA